MTTDRQRMIDEMKAKLIKSATEKVWGGPDNTHDVNFKEVVGTLKDETGVEKDIKITSVRMEKK